jgi:hypothetical protein
VEKMSEAPASMKTRAFLIFCAVGLAPIALGYGAKPSASLDFLFGITVDTTNLTHIMRAVMGLYLGMVVIWIWGAFNKQMTAPALVSCAVFMLGLAAGRILSLIVDGMPHWLLVVARNPDRRILNLSLYPDPINPPAAMARRGIFNSSVKTTTPVKK